MVDFRLEGSADRFVWTGDRVSGVCAALCVCRRANVVERGLYLASAAGGRERRQQGQKHAQEGQDMKVLRRTAIVACLDSVMNMKILEVEVVSLLFCLST